jgi:hypothetical protein
MKVNKKFFAENILEIEKNTARKATKNDVK